MSLAKTTHVASAVGAAGAATTLTITAIADTRFLIGGIQINRATNGAEATAAAHTITTTGIPGTPSWVVAAAMAEGTQKQDVDVTFDPPLASNPGVNVTVVCPNPGTTPLWSINAWYQTERV
ncbi:MAG: hypothetical protein ACYTEQ_23750 [Planctomycetota bacterium]|jgi:hypothetical protein